MGNQMISSTYAWCCSSNNEDLNSDWRTGKERLGKRSVLPYAAPVVNFQEERAMVQSLQNKELLALYDNEIQGDFKEAYTLGQKLGEGAFSCVYEGQCRETQKKYAIKVTKRCFLKKDALTCTLMEPYILKRLYHRGIMRFHAFYKDDEAYYLIVEELVGGALLDNVASLSHYTEKDVCRIMKQLLEALEYIHARNIVHRDLKLDNLMMTTHEVDCSLKIVDFGFADVVESERPLYKVLGTPGYMAPEVIKGGPYGKAADMWSVGVIMYTLLSGYPPFHHDYVHDIHRLFRIVCSGFYVFDSPYWDNVSEEAKNVIASLLVLNPTQRASAKQLLSHKWFSEASPSEANNSCVNMLPVMSNLGKFKKHLKKRVWQRKHSVEVHSERHLPASLDEMEMHPVFEMAHKKLHTYESVNPVQSIAVDFENSILLPELKGPIDI